MMNFLEIDINYIDLIEIALKINNISYFIFICPKTKKFTEEELNDHISINIPMNHSIDDVHVINYIGEHNTTKYKNYYLWNIYEVIFTNEIFFLKILKYLDRCKKIQAFI